jgi:hypothetical protein
MTNKTEKIELSVKKALLIGFIKTKANELDFFRPNRKFAERYAERKYIKTRLNLNA